MGHARLETVEDVFAALGGVTAVANLTGRSVQAVCNWRERARMAPTTFALLSAELSKLDKTASLSLWGMDEPEGVE